jgi:nuclear pore complex protein Nup160
MLMLLFNNAIDVANYDDAYMAFTRLTNYQTLSHFVLPYSSQRGALETLVVAMVEHGQSGRLCTFPFNGLQDAADEILLNRAEEVVDIRPSPSYHKVLFAWRIRHGDFQGAASVMYQRLQLLRNASTAGMDVNLETLEISEAYLAVINALSCVADKNAWIFVSKLEECDEPSPTKRVRREQGGNWLSWLTLGTRTRMAMSLEEVRKEYVLELQRQEIILGKVTDEFGLEGVDI